MFLWTFKGKTVDVESFNTSSLFEIEIANLDKDKGQYCKESHSEHKHFEDKKENE